MKLEYKALYMKNIFGNWVATDFLDTNPFPCAGKHVGFGSRRPRWRQQDHLKPADHKRHFWLFPVVLLVHLADDACCVMSMLGPSTGHLPSPKFLPATRLVAWCCSATIATCSCATKVTGTSMGNPVSTESYVPWSKGPGLDQIPSGPSGGWLSIHFRDWYTHWMVNDHVLTQSTY